MSRLAGEVSFTDGLVFGVQVDESDDALAKMRGKRFYLPLDAAPPGVAMHSRVSVEVTLEVPPECAAVLVADGCLELRCNRKGRHDVHNARWSSSSGPVDFAWQAGA